jgi:flagellar basal body-associated protein FliL
MDNRSYNEREDENKAKSLITLVVVLVVLFALGWLLFSWLANRDNNGIVDDPLNNNAQQQQQQQQDQQQQADPQTEPDATDDNDTNINLEDLDPRDNTN